MSTRTRGKIVITKPETFGPQIAILREDRGWPQVKLAESIGMAVGRLRFVEGTRLFPTIDEVFALARVLEVEILIAPAAEGSPR
jgi:ribosome-binding protein aMBF1 (putative translation factor)